MAMLETVKLCLRITTDAFDGEITDLIEAAAADLGVAGVSNLDTDDALVRRAVITYCKAHFGEPGAEAYDRLKAAYDEQKAQMSMATGYTDWGSSNGSE